MTVFSIVCMAALAAVSHDVAVVDAGKNADDTKTVKVSVKVVERFLAAEGIKFDRVSEKAVARGALENRAVAVLPYNPNPNEETIAGLEKFVKRGGKLFVCYTLPERLGKLLGFKPGKWQRGKRPGHFAEIRFDGSIGITGMPPSLKQASWNIATAEPAGHNARVVARWHDDQEKPTGEPAMLISDRGAFLTHIILDNDPRVKQKMLLAVLGRLAPSVWEQAYGARLKGIGQVGHCRSLDELADYIKANRVKAGDGPHKAAAELKAAQKLLAKAELQYGRKSYHDAVASVDKAHGLLGHAYLLSQPSPAVEARGWWCHSGTGPYPGDWDRTLKELSESGFNMVFPNMLWGGAAHYPSDILPRSEVHGKYGDQIFQCLAAAKKYGIEMHVWKVNYCLSHHAPKSFVEKLRRQGRTQVSIDGQPKDWLCPSHPENFKLEVASMIEVVEKYDVDGVHFDYIRYPDGGHCYCDGCRKRFEADSGRKIENWPADCHGGSRHAEYRDWRTRQIARLVAAVHGQAKKIRKGVKISAAVFGSYPACRDSVGQDWVRWAKAGYVDFLCPMDYTDSDRSFRALIENQLRLLDGCVPIYPGIGATATRGSLSAARVVGQIQHARALGAGGFMIFNLSEPAIKTIAPGFGLGAGRRPATPPHGQR